MNFYKNPTVGYRLDLFDGTYYLGVTTNLTGRLSQHFSSTSLLMHKLSKDYKFIPDLRLTTKVEIVGWFSDGYAARYWENICHRSVTPNCRSQVLRTLNEPIEYPFKMICPSISCYSANLV